MPDPPVTIVPVDSEAERRDLWTLLAEFHEWLCDHIPPSHDPEAGLDEDVRSLARETESWAWIARVDDVPAGCVLLYGETDDLAEFRRLWVRPAHRGRGIGRLLTRTVIDRAREEGYETLGLTTPPRGEAAHALYESLGFERTPPYPGTRLDERHHDDAIFMQLGLTATEEKATTQEKTRPG